MTDPTPDLESIRKRHEAAVNLARDLQHATLHGPVPIATTMQMAGELVWASGEIIRLTAALATAKDEERAAVVAWLRGEAHFTDVGPLDTFADAYADGIEAWQKGHYMSFPFQSKNIDKTYGNQRLVLVPSR